MLRPNSLLACVFLRIQTGPAYLSKMTVLSTGIDPNDVRGKIIGVYNATTCDDGFRIRISDQHNFNLNCIRAMAPNRASYSLDLKGECGPYF